MEEMTPAEARETLEAAGWAPSEMEVWRRGLELCPALIESFKAHCERGAVESTEMLVAREDAEARGAVKALRSITYMLDLIVSALREVEDA